MQSFKEYSAKNVFRNKSDITIRTVKSYIITESKINEIFNSVVTVQQKPSGMKVILIKEDNTGRAEEDWTVKHKNKIIYPGEFNYVSSTMVEKYSTGISQLKLVWEHLKRLHKTDIPTGTELFVEFITKSENSKYNKYYDMVLIKAIHKSTLNEGSIVPNDTIDSYAKELDISVPYTIFEGKIASKTDFDNGILDENLKKVYRNSSIDWLDRKNTIKDIQNVLLETESKYGGKENGVVIKYGDTVLKSLNSKDKQSIKYKTIFENVNESYNYTQQVKAKNIEDALAELSNILSKSKEPFDIVESIHATSKNILLKKFSKNSVIVGTFQDLEKSRETIIESLAKFESTTICIVSNSNTKGTKRERNEKILENFPTVNVINSSTTDLDFIIQKIPTEITTAIIEDIEIKNSSILGVSIES